MGSRFAERWIIPGEWVNDGVADCGDTDGDGTSDDEGVTGWYTTIEGDFETWVSAGEHTFTWTYAKDGSVDGGDDFAGIDNIVFPYGIPGEGECDDTADLCNTEDMDDDDEERVENDESYYIYDYSHDSYDEYYSYNSDDDDFTDDA